MLLAVSLPAVVAAAVPMVDHRPLVVLGQITASVALTLSVLLAAQAVKRQHRPVALARLALAVVADWAPMPVVLVVMAALTTGRLLAVAPAPVAVAAVALATLPALETLAAQQQATAAAVVVAVTVSRRTALAALVFKV